MADNTKHLEASWQKRSNDAKEKSLKAIDKLKLKNEPINFSSVHKKSGVSKHFLYKDEEIRSIIENNRKTEKIKDAIYHEKYDKTAKSKDVIIKAKDKYIEKLEADNQKLHKELNKLRAFLYENK